MKKSLEDLDSLARAARELRERHEREDAEKKAREAKWLRHWEERHRRALEAFVGVPGDVRRTAGVFATLLASPEWSKLRDIATDIVPGRGNREETLVELPHLGLDWEAPCALFRDQPSENQPVGPWHVWRLAEAPVLEMRTYGRCPIMIRTHFASWSALGLSFPRLDDRSALRRFSGRLFSRMDRGFVLELHGAGMLAVRRLVDAVANGEIIELATSVLQAQVKERVGRALY